MPRPVLSKYQTKASAATVAAQTTAGSDAQEEDGQHAASGPGCWRSAWCTCRATITRKLWHSPQHSHVWRHSASNSPNTHTWHVSGPPTDDGHSCRRPAAWGTGPSGLHGTPAPHAPSVSSNKWRIWARGHHELSSTPAANGPSAAEWSCEHPSAEPHPSVILHWETTWLLSAAPVAW